MAYKIGVTGGKGGVGKSTIVTALALELVKRGKKVLLLDLDVDCPNNHIILSVKRKKVRDIMQTIPKWDFKKCTKCGTCSKVCKENAIVFVKGKYPIFVPEQCIGCTACIIACPSKAISKGKRRIGTIYQGKNYDVDLMTGEMEIGYEEASPIVNATKRFSSKIEKDYDYVLTDTSPGTHCNVISALLDVDLALAVTEPTPLGKHDLELILKLLKVLKIKGKIILNRADIGDKKLIIDVADKYKTRIISEIPYRKEILEAYSKGKPIRDENISKVCELLIK